MDYSNLLPELASPEKQTEYAPLLKKANKLFKESYNLIDEFPFFETKACLDESPQTIRLEDKGVEYLPVKFLEDTKHESGYGKIMEAYLLDYVPRHEGFELAVSEKGINFPDCHFVASILAREAIVECSKDFLEEVRSSESIKQRYSLVVPQKNKKVYQVIKDVSKEFNISFNESCGFVYGGNFGRKSYIVKELEDNAHTPEWEWKTAKEMIKKWEK